MALTTTTLLWTRHRKMRIWTIWYYEAVYSSKFLKYTLKADPSKFTYGVVLIQEDPKKWSYITFETVILQANFFFKEKIFFRNINFKPQYKYNFFTLL